ncbi:FtsX-like permease family protein [Algoriphagus sp. C2-6-M1]|uniref:ABC transporter permease n=1 Tax=Algoriphagus persicinus TaxID=3108754 RepID=UPI002B3BB354|nr:ABC transporter permease [Algoriphagus sp. C2-6-M1]MEB2782378.1 FtsX-like permease family protein [Algoriphagus sp. C2-6-M1]
MLKHHLLLIYRNLRKDKSTFLINLIGLSTGLASVLLIFLWVNDELQIDKGYATDSQLYQLLENVDQAGGVITRETTAGPTAQALKDDFPEVEYAVTSFSNNINSDVLSFDEKDIAARKLYASADFFKLFPYNITQGNKENVKSEPNTIVISESLAVKLFGSSENAVGKAVKWDHEKDLSVAGVFEDVPATASMKFDFVMSFEDFWIENEWVQSWGNTAPTTFVLLREATDVNEFNAKIKDFVKTKTEGNVTHRSQFVTKYSDRYLQGNYENGVQSGGRISYVKLFSIIALFILVIACINFMNLSTAKASKRIKEVGIKKAVGAKRGELIFQYLGESTMMAFLSLLLGLLLVILLLPQFNTITEKQLTLDFSPMLIMAIVTIVLITGLIAGSYPALHLSGFSPSIVLKGKISSAGGELWVRKGLVVFQFALSVILIVSVWVVYLQIEYIQTENLGYDKDNVLLISKIGELANTEKTEAFISELKAVPGVVGATSSGHDMTGHNGGTYGIQWPGKDPNDKTEFERMAVNYGMIEMMGIQMKEGRIFSDEFGTESERIIFNAAAIEFMGIEDPIGKVISLWGDDKEIIGVTEDFHFDSFHEVVKPLFFYYSPESTNLVAAKINAGDEMETIKKIEALHSTFNPGFLLDYRFLDEDFQALYVSEQRVATLSKYFAGIAILISCLGLFGLATFTVERRAKEIGIRKVLGASELKIVSILSGDFAKMVLLAILIALPLSFFIVQEWLANFAFKIDLEWWFFIGAGVLTLLIALLTVSFQSINAALMNPVKSLKSE